MSSFPRASSVVLLAGLALAASPCRAETCEALSAQIDAKIRAAGVSSFSLQVVDAAASAPGRVVGSCGNGSRRIVYTQTRAVPGAVPAALPAAPPAAARAVTPVMVAASGPARVPAAPPPPARPAPKPAKASTEPILTECLDGTESLDGTCAK